MKKDKKNKKTIKEEIITEYVETGEGISIIKIEEDEENIDDKHIIRDNIDNLNKE